MWKDFNIRIEYIHEYFFIYISSKYMLQIRLEKLKLVYLFKLNEILISLAWIFNLFSAKAHFLQH